MTASAIRLGGTYGIGSIDLLENQVTAEGGPHDPRILLPLQVRMEPSVADRMLALTELVCSVHLLASGSHAHPGNQTGPTVALNLVSGLPCRSLASVGEGYRVDLRIPLTAPLVGKLEDHRHSTGGKDFTGVLSLQGTVVWVYRTGGERGSLTQPLDAASMHGELFPSGMGLYSIFAPFWDVRVEDLAFRVSESTWVEKVLPGLGLDRLRLVEVSLPSTPGPLPASIIPALDEARRKFDSGDYVGCVGVCRRIREATSKHLRVPQKKSVAEVVANRLLWGNESPRRAFLDSGWKAFVDLTNAAHHGDAPPDLYEPEARACLLLAVMLIEYLQVLLSPARPAEHAGRN